MPTTRQGECGTVLIIAPSEGVSWAVGLVRLGVLMGVLHAVGGVGVCAKVMGREGSLV